MCHLPNSIILSREYHDNCQLASLDWLLCACPAHPSHLCWWNQDGGCQGVDRGKLCLTHLQLWTSRSTGLTITLLLHWTRQCPFFPSAQHWRMWDCEYTPHSCYEDSASGAQHDGFADGDLEKLPELASCWPASGCDTHQASSSCTLSIPKVAQLVYYLQLLVQNEHMV